MLIGVLFLIAMCLVLCVMYCREINAHMNTEADLRLAKMRYRQLKQQYKDSLI